MSLIRALERRNFLANGPYPQVLQVGASQALMLLCLQQEQELRAPDGDDAETTFIVLDGSGEVVDGSDRHHVESGDVVHVAAGHGKALHAGAGTFTVLGVRSRSAPPQTTEAEGADTAPAATQEDSMSDTQAPPVIDVRTIPPRERHPLLFERFDALASGEAYELVNDHDPKPLYYQFEAERPGQLKWDYLEDGPEVWRVRVGKR